jgi:GGDEF domain-containing protein
MKHAVNNIRSQRNPVTKPGAHPSPWLGQAAALADVAFELDSEGRFLAFGDDVVFGYDAESLIGVPANALFNVPAGAFDSVIADLAAQPGAWLGKIAIRQASGSVSMFRLALAAKPAKTPTHCIAGLLTDLEAPLIDISYTEASEIEDAAIQVSRLLCPNTGLWSLASFIEQTARRFDRLDVEDRPGTLLCLGFSRASAALQTPVALRLTEELREIIRPTDLLGRIAPAIIALWCDGMDHLTGAERAARFCKYLPTTVPGHILISAGVATRWPGNADDPETMIERAGLALRDAEAATDRDAIGRWRVWQKNPAA